MRASRGFTVLELVLALALAGLVMSSVVGLYVFMARANDQQAAALTSAMSRSMAHGVVRRAMGDLVAATPLVPGVAPSQPAGDPQGDGASPLNAITGANPAAPILFEPGVRDGQPVMFDLSIVSMEGGGRAQRLEFVTLAPPAALDMLDEEELRFTPTDEDRLRWANPDRVRSVFEFVLGEGGWALAWRPIDPPGQRVVVVDRVLWGEWSVLLPTTQSARRARSSERWESVHAAFLREDFPIALRFECETEDGEQIDWLFETLVVTRSY